MDSDDELYMGILNHGAKIPYTYDEWCDRLLDFLYNAIKPDDRIFNGRLNRGYAEKYAYYRIHNSFLGKFYRRYKRISYYVSDLWRVKR